MSLAPLLAELEAHHVCPVARDGRLKLRGRQSCITAELVERVRAAKAELLAYLQAGAKAEPYPITEHEENRIDRLARTDGWTPPAGIAPEVAAEIRRIEPQALILGWRRERLWNLQFWPHSAEHPRGLASVMDLGDEVAELTADCITILHRRRDLLRFSRIDG